MAYDVVVKEVAPEHLAGIRGTYRIAELPEVMPRELRRIMAALQTEGMQPAGGAVAVYHGWDEETVDAEIGVPIRGVFFPRDPKAGIKAGMVPGGRAVFTVHVGAYDELGAAYEAIREYAKAKGLELADRMWEKYLSDAAIEPDLGRHITEVYWPLK